jgi:hypothetical protein
VRVHLAGEHALEFQLLDLRREPAHVALDLGDRALIRLRRREVQQLARIGERGLEPIEAADDLLQLGPLPAELLRPVGLVPDTRLLELALYFLQPLVLVVVIKDTSSESRRAPRDL